MVILRAFLKMLQLVKREGFASSDRVFVAVINQTSSTTTSDDEAAVEQPKPKAGRGRGRGRGSIQSSGMNEAFLEQTNPQTAIGGGRGGTIASGTVEQPKPKAGRGRGGKHNQTNPQTARGNGNRGRGGTQSSGVDEASMEQPKRSTLGTEQLKPFGSNLDCSNIVQQQGSVQPREEGCLEHPKTSRSPKKSKEMVECSVVKWSSLETCSRLANSGVDLGVVFDLYKKKFSGIQVQLIKAGRQKILEDYPEFASTITDWCKISHSPTWDVVDFDNLNHFYFLKDFDVADKQILEIILSRFTVNTLEQYQMAKDVVSLVKDFDQHLAKCEQWRRDSDNTKRMLLTPFSLYKENSPLYLVQNLKDDFYPSSYKVSCDYGATYPLHKYEQYIDYLFEEPTYGVHNILVLIEPPGSGKTHISYHLTKQSKKIVIPLVPKLTNELTDYLIEARSKERSSFDIRSRKFFGKLVAFVQILRTWESIKCSESSYSILRYMWNGGSLVLGKFCKIEIEPKINKESKSEVVFLLDEAQLFNTSTIVIPRKTQSENGTLLTLLTSTLREMGPVILTTTFAEAIDGKLENCIYPGAAKHMTIKYSYNFQSNLPILHFNDVILFLGMFITVKEDYVWNLVAYFLQGPFRRAEYFLQELFDRLKNTNQPCSTPSMISSVLATVVHQETLFFGSLEMKENQSLTKELFYKLALFGEATFCGERDVFSKFLLTHSMVHTFDYTKNIFQITSPIDQWRLQEILKNVSKQDEKDWFEHACEIWCQLPNTSSLPFLTELLAMWVLLEHFNIIASDLAGSYLSEYIMLATYYFRDIQLSSKANSNVPMRGSTLLLQTISMSENLLGADKTITKSLIFPNIRAGPDILGALKKVNDTTKGENLIPLSVAVSLQTSESKFKKDYNTTHIENMYKQHSAMEEDKEIQKEREMLEPFLDKISSKRLRILFHPNAKFSRALKERIVDYSSGDDVCITEYGPHAILTDKGHLIYEISSCNENWQNCINKHTFLKSLIGMLSKQPLEE